MDEFSVLRAFDNMKNSASSGPISTDEALMQLYPNSLFFVHHCTIVQ